MKGQAEISFSLALAISAWLSSRRVCVLNRRSYSQFNIRGLTAAGLQDALRQQCFVAPAMFAALASHFVATAGCAHLQQRRVFGRACRMIRCPKRHLGSHPTTSRQREEFSQEKTYRKLVSLSPAPLPSCARSPIPSRRARGRWRRWRQRGEAFALRSGRVSLRAS